MSNTQEVLDVLQGRIEIELKRKRISASSKAQFEILQLFVIYLQDDHKKVSAMWSTYKPMAWVIGIFFATFIGMVASGRVSLIIR